MEKNNNEKRFFFKNKANIIIFTILAILGIAASIIIPRIAGGGSLIVEMIQTTFPIMILPVM